MTDMPDEIWVAAEATCSGMWSSNIGSINENYTPEKYIRAEVAEKLAEALKVAQGYMPVGKEIYDSGIERDVVFVTNTLAEWEKVK